MARIVSVHASKGGVGKSTMTLQIASCFHSMGLKVAIFDFDTQGTLTVLQGDRKRRAEADLMPEMPFPVYYKDDINKVVNTLDDDTIVFLDFLPSSKAETVAVAGEIFIVPFRAARADEASALPGINVLRKLGIPVIPVANFYTKQAQADYLHDIEQQIGPCLTVNDRQLYENAMNIGAGVWEKDAIKTLYDRTTPALKAARDEILALANNVLLELNKIKPITIPKAITA